jgi:hypothetical protein
MQAPKVAPRWFLLIPLVLIIFNLYTIMGTLTISPQYADLDVSFSPVLRLGIGLVWIVVFGALTVGLIIRRPFAYLWIAPALTIYGLANLVQGILWAQADYIRGQFGFQAIATALALIPVWWIALRRNWISLTKGANAPIDEKDTAQ